MRKDLAALFALRRGHFEFESRHHGDTWLELEQLCHEPHALAPRIDELAARVARYDVELICGPLVEGALIGLLVAQKLELPFVYTQRSERAGATGLFPIDYPLPEALRPRVAGRRVAIVNDAINAGSAVGRSLASLRDAGANASVVACLLTLGNGASALARREGVALEALDAVEHGLWEPEACPLCRDRVPLVPHPGS